MEPKSDFDDNNNNICCNQFADSLGSAIDQVSELILKLIESARIDINEGGLTPEEFKVRVILIRATYTVYKSYYEAALLEAQNAKCGKECCQGIAKGLLNSTLGIAKLVVTNTLNPLFSNEEAAAYLSLSIDDLASTFEVILLLAGCDKFCACTEVLSHFDNAYKQIL